VRKRILHIAILGAAIAIGMDLWSLATSAVNPPSAAGAWTLSGAADCVKSIPIELQTWRGIARARRVCRAEYAGSPTMRLTLVEMPEQPGASAFDAWQKWRPAQPGKLGFYKGRVFGVAESPLADQATLDRFTVAVEKALPRGSEGRW
jgi:hypothetical protein